MGISTTGAGKLSFALAAFIGALSGLLIGPTTTVFYDSGFLIGLKGFVAAIFGGLASYPAAAARRADRRRARELRLVLGQRLQGGDRLHPDHPGAAVALVPARPRRRGGAVTLTSRRRPALRRSFALADRWPLRAGRCAGARVLDHPGQLHRPVHAGRARPGAAHRRRRAHLVRPGGLRRPRRLHRRLPDADLRRLALAHRLDRPGAHRAWRALVLGAGSRCACRATTCRWRPSPGACRSTTCSATSTSSASTTACSASRRSTSSASTLNTGRSFFYLLWAHRRAGGARP